MFIILDRDGVINYDSDQYIKSPDEWRAIPGSLEAIAQLNRVGYRVLIATNQSGVARGYYDIQTLDAIHEKLARELAAVGGFVEEFFFCPHHPDDGCDCRKPKTGMIDNMLAKYPFQPEQTYFVGDSIGDIKAAVASGCEPVLVKTGNGERTLAQYPEMANIKQFANLAEVVDFILSEEADYAKN